MGEYQNRLVFVSERGWGVVCFSTKWKGCLRDERKQMLWVNVS